MANGDTLLKSDKCTLVLEATKDGKIRLQNSALHEGIVLLPDQVLEVRWQGGQVHLMRRAKRRTNSRPIRRAGKRPATSEALCRYTA